MLRQDFGGQCVAGAACAEVLSGCCGLGIGVTGLNHKAVDYPVEQDSVVEAFFHEFLEIVAVYGGITIEFYLDGAHCGL